MEKSVWQTSLRLDSTCPVTDIETYELKLEAAFVQETIQQASNHIPQNVQMKQG